MKILLIGNYQPDRQQSMQRYAELLYRELKILGHEVDLIHPEVVLGKQIKGYGGWSRFIGYVDKLMLAPRIFRRLKKSYDLVHICDHSNAYYATCFDLPVVVTCHDLIAIRAAKGDSMGQKTSLLGHFLQRMIRKGLGNADRVISVSKATQDDLRTILPKFDEHNSQVIHHCLNQDFSHLEAEARDQAWQLLLPELQSATYLLHVGSNSPRKNREGVIRLFAEFKQSEEGRDAYLVFAGEAIDKKGLKLAGTLGVREELISIAKPSHEQLQALYNFAYAFVFPSLCEGFGWPIIEAQACGCPVITSKENPMREICGNDDLCFAVDDYESMTKALVKLCDEAFRQECIQRGLENLKRFSKELMIQAYVKAYQQTLNTNR